MAPATGSPGKCTVYYGMGGGDEFRWTVDLSFRFFLKEKDFHRSLSRHPLAPPHIPSLPPLPFSLLHPHTRSAQAPFSARRVCWVCWPCWAPWGQPEDLGSSSSPIPFISSRGKWKGLLGMCGSSPTVFHFQNILVRHFWPLKFSTSLHQ